MLAITLLFANLSKLVAICNILSKYCLCQNRKPFFDLPRQRCAHNCLPTTLHSPHRGEAYSQHCAIVGRPRAVWPLHGGVALVRRYVVTGVFYLATFANLVAERTAVRPNSGFCAAAVYLRQPFNITSASYHQALEHCQAQKPLNTIIIQFPLHTKYIILPLKCEAFNLSKNSGHKKANFRLINKYSNFPHFTFIVQSISFDFLQTLL